MASSILTLPGEIVDNIAHLLPPKDLDSFRHTCHELEAKSFKCFSTTRFTSKEITLSRSGIAELEEFSLSPFAAHLREIKFRYAGEIEQTYLWPYAVTVYGGQRRHTHTYESMTAAACAYYLDLEKYIREWATGMLRPVLTRLTSLKSVSIEACSKMTETWRSMYEAYSETEPSNDLCFDKAIRDPQKEYNCYRSETAALVLAAVFDAGIALQSLHLNIKCVNEHITETLAIKPDHMPRFKDVASSLQNLSLTGVLLYDNTVETYLSSMGNLRTLCIKTHNLDHEDFTQLFGGSFFPHLNELQLDSCREVSEDDLFSFVSRHGQTLRRLQLFNIRLSASWNSSWSSFFDRLRTSSLRLEYLNVRYLVHDLGLDGFEGTESVDLKKAKLLDLAAVVETMDIYSKAAEEAESAEKAKSAEEAESAKEAESAEEAETA